MEKPPAPDQTPKAAPTLTARALAEKQARELREAAALRANLQRRKQQARSRATPPPDPPAAANSGHRDEQH